MIEDSIKIQEKDDNNENIKLRRTMSDEKAKNKIEKILDIFKKIEEGVTNLYNL